MKRSEMIELIINLINDYNDWEREEHYVDIAENILYGMEKVGILPPINEWFFMMDGDNANPNNTLYRKWEPENE